MTLKVNVHIPPPLSPASQNKMSLTCVETPLATSPPGRVRSVVHAPGTEVKQTGHDSAEPARKIEETMTTTYSRARGAMPHENGTEQRSGPPIVRNAFGANGRGEKNNSSSSTASISSSIGKVGGSSVHARLGSTAVNGGHSLAYTYAPLEHSSDSSWHQIPKSLASAVLGVDPCSTTSTPVGDHAGGGGGGGAGGAMSHQSKTYKMAVKRTAMSVSLSCCFGLATMIFRGRQSGLEFFAGYLVEQSLSEYTYRYIPYVSHVPAQDEPSCCCCCPRCCHCHVRNVAMIVLSVRALLISAPLQPELQRQAGPPLLVTVALYTGKPGT